MASAPNWHDASTMFSTMKVDRPSNHATEPAWLTLLRIALIPVFVGVFFLPFRGANLLCTALFGLAALTDWLDGYLARRLDQTSAFGAFLDPVADKLMVAAALVCWCRLFPPIDGGNGDDHHRPRNRHLRIAGVDGADRGMGG